MAIYRAEDISVGIDGTEIAATSLSFSSSSPLVEDRRLGKEIGGKDFLVNGPQKSSLNVSFYLTGSATGENPIFQLLNGEDAYSVNVLSGVSGFEEIEGKVFKRRLDPEVTGSIYEYIGDYHSYSFRYDPNSDVVLLWKAAVSGGSWLTGDDVFGTGYWTGSGALESGTGEVSRAGTLGALTGSTIYLGGNPFASGAALTSLSFAISPFSPVICNASFDIFNPVTGAFTSGEGSISISPTSLAHGMFSYYSGVTGISDVQEISWEIVAERVPRYVIGKKNVYEIKTSRAVKTLNFRGWGPSTPVLQDAPDTFIVSLGSQAGEVFSDTVSGEVGDESFDVPGAGLMSKSFTIIENLL